MTFVQRMLVLHRYSMLRANDSFCLPKYQKPTFA